MGGDLGGGCSSRTRDAHWSSEVLPLLEGPQRRGGRLSHRDALSQRCLWLDLHFQGTSSQSWREGRWGGWKREPGSFGAEYV